MSHLATGIVVISRGQTCTGNSPVATICLATGAYGQFLELWPLQHLHGPRSKIQVQGNSGVNLQHCSFPGPWDHHLHRLISKKPSQWRKLDPLIDPMIPLKRFTLQHLEHIHLQYIYCCRKPFCGSRSGRYMTFHFAIKILFYYHHIIWNLGIGQYVNIC